MRYLLVKRFNLDAATPSLVPDPEIHPAKSVEDAKVEDDVQLEHAESQSSTSEHVVEEEFEWREIWRGIFSYVTPDWMDIVIHKLLIDRCF